jgi:hypothetical protein
MTNFKFQINFNHPMTEIRNHLWFIRNWNLGLICNLACLREAASAKAGAWDLVLRLIEVNDAKMGNGD